MEDKYLNISQAARIKGCERWTIYRNIYVGNLDAEIVAGTLHVLKNEKFERLEIKSNKQHKKEMWRQNATN